MNDGLPKTFDTQQTKAKHPPVSVIEDVFTFKMNRFVMINERQGHRWSQKLFDLSLNEWRLLALIKSKSAAHAGNLAELMLMDKSQLTRLIKSLAVKKLIKSSPDSADARAVILSLTPKGAALYVDMMAVVMRTNENVLAPLSAEEVALFTDMLDRLTAHSLSGLTIPVDQSS